MRCGRCKEIHESADQVRACYGQVNRKSGVIRRARFAIATAVNRPTPQALGWSSGTGLPKIPKLRMRSATPATGRLTDYHLWAPRPPRRFCETCNCDVVNCEHLETYWCQECKVYTESMGFHQNCLGSD